MSFVRVGKKEANRAHLPIIASYSWESLGPSSYATQGINSIVSGNSVWPAANRAFYVPFTLVSAITVVKMWVFNGATVNGNVDVGIYNNAGTLIVQHGGTAMAGATTIQEFDITDTKLAPGRYYMAMSCSSATATFFRILPGDQAMVPINLKQQATAYPLPTPTATFAISASGYMPTFGISQRTLVV